MHWHAVLLLLATVATAHSLPLLEERDPYTGSADHVGQVTAALGALDQLHHAGGGSKRGFQPWGGKREAGLAELAWGGPRDDLLDVDGPRAGPADSNSWPLTKRQAPSVDELKRRFNPWAGKRSVLVGEQAARDDGDDNGVDNDDSQFDGDLDKRAFNPWGGKRASFNPWGGKRASFNPWGGKRASFNPWGGKRASFQPWGGKRASFNPWGGKRASFQPWGGKRASFNPWGGKRASFQPWGGKRASFQPWGGKRGDESVNEVESRDELN